MKNRHHSFFIFMVAAVVNAAFTHQQIRNAITPLIPYAPNAAGTAALQAALAPIMNAHMR